MLNKRFRTVLISGLIIALTLSGCDSGSKSDDLKITILQKPDRSKIYFDQSGRLLGISVIAPNNQEVYVSEKTLIDENSSQLGRQRYNEFISHFAEDEKEIAKKRIIMRTGELIQSDGTKGLLRLQEAVSIFNSTTIDERLKVEEKLSIFDQSLKLASKKHP